MADNKQILHFQQVFPSGSGDSQGKCRLLIQSDVSSLAKSFMEETITPASRPHVRLPATVVKAFGFRLETEDGDLVAGCTAYFANGATLQYRQSDADRATEELPEDTLHDMFDAWLSNGTSFVLVTDFRLDAARGKGFGEWLARYVPRILSDVYGLTFGKVVVVLHEEAFEHIPEKGADADGLDKKQLSYAMTTSLENLGYERIEDEGYNGIMVFCSDR